MWARLQERSKGNSKEQTRLRVKGQERRSSQQGDRLTARATWTRHLVPTIWSCKVFILHKYQCWGRRDDRDWYSFPCLIAGRLSTSRKHVVGSSSNSVTALLKAQMYFIAALKMRTEVLQEDEDLLTRQAGLVTGGEDLYSSVRNLERSWLDRTRLPSYNQNC